MSTVLISIAILVVVLIIGVPIPFAFLASTLTIIMLGGYDYSFLVPYGYTEAGSIIIVAVL